MADPRVQDRLANHQIYDPEINLTSLRSSSYGQFIYNLHVVLVHRERGADVSNAWLRKTCDTIRRVARKKEHLLSRASLLSDHIHMTLGCDVSETPADVVLSYMNHLAYVQDNKAIFQFGFYVGTFGPYDLDAVRP